MADEGQAVMKPGCREMGRLCSRGHDHGGGSSLRYLVRGKPQGDCVECSRERCAAGKQVARARRHRRSEDGCTYVPDRPCRLGHQQRYVLDGGCCECTRARGRERYMEPEEHARRAKYDRMRQRAATRFNLKRACRGLTDADLIEQRRKTYRAESERRRLLAAIKGN